MSIKILMGEQIGLLRIDETVEFHMSLKCFGKVQKVILQLSGKLFFHKLRLIFRLIDCIAGGITTLAPKRMAPNSCDFTPPRSMKRTGFS